MRTISTNPGSVNRSFSCSALALLCAGLAACGSSGGQSGTDESGVGQLETEPSEPERDAEDGDEVEDPEDEDPEDAEDEDPEDAEEDQESAAPEGDVPSQPVPGEDDEEDFGSEILPAPMAGDEVDSDTPAPGTEVACSEFPMVVGSGRLVQAREVNGYAFSSALRLQTMSVSPDATALTVGWDSLSSDIAGRAIDPMTDIDLVTFSLWHLDADEFAVGLNANALDPNDLVAIATIETNHSTMSSPYYDFTSLGNPVEPEILDAYLDPAEYPPGEYTYAVMAASGTSIGAGTRMVQIFSPEPSSTNTHVPIDSRSVLFDYHASLSSLTPLAVPFETPDLMLEWSGVAVNALGNPFARELISRIVVAKHEGTPSDLETRLFELELGAEEVWSAELDGGISVELASLTTDAGEPFAGFDASGTWVVALVCGSCTNPAPWYLTVVTNCAE